MSLSNPPKEPDEVNLRKGCNTMKHLDANGLCGRCQPDPKRTLDKENSYMGDITPDQVDALDAILEDWFMKPKADLKAKLSALLVDARLDELRIEEASRQRGGAIPLRLTNRIYELEKELRDLEKQREATE